MCRDSELAPCSGLQRCDINCREWAILDRKKHLANCEQLRITHNHWEFDNGIRLAKKSRMKLMQNPHNWIRALLPTAGSIMGQAQSPTIILPLRTEPSV